MSDQEINIAIAEACGWRKYTQFTTYPALWGKSPARYHTPIWGLTLVADMTQDQSTVYGWHGDGHISIVNISNYCNDLNAMHEAEKKLTPFQRIKHGHFLQEILNEAVVGFVSNYEGELKSLSRVASATARQRAEILLRTLGKWEETK